MLWLAFVKGKTMKTSFEKFSGWMAILAGSSGFLYAVAFIVLQSNLFSALFLLLGGLFSVPALIGLYQRLHGIEEGFALLGLLVTLSAALGSAIHGGYDLSNTLHPPASLSPELPNPIDPRGLLTFGIAGLGLFVLSWLMTQSMNFPKGLAYLGTLSAILMIVLYLGRLIILQATSLVIVIPALLEGFIVNPIWYIWLGLRFFRDISRSN
jgi:hypothetical protein